MGDLDRVARDTACARCVPAQCLDALRTPSEVPLGTPMSKVSRSPSSSAFWPRPGRRCRAAVAGAARGRRGSTVPRGRRGRRPLPRRCRPRGPARPPRSPAGGGVDRREGLTRPRRHHLAADQQLLRRVRPEKRGRCDGFRRRHGAPRRACPSRAGAPCARRRRGWAAAFRRGTVGMTLASITRRPSTPTTRQSGSTTRSGSPSGPSGRYRRRGPCR